MDTYIVGVFRMPMETNALREWLNLEAAKGYSLINSVAVSGNPEIIYTMELDFDEETYNDRGAVRFSVPDPGPGDGVDNEDDDEYLDPLYDPKWQAVFADAGD